MIPLIWIIAGIAGAVGLGAAAAASDESDKRKKDNEISRIKKFVKQNKKFKKDFDKLMNYLVNLDIYIDTNIWMHSNDEFFELLDMFLTNFNKKIIMSKVEYDEKIKVKVDAKTNSNKEAIKNVKRAIALIDKFQKRGLLEIKNIQNQKKSTYADDFYIDLANKKSDFFVITRDRDLSIRLNAIRTEKTSEDKIEFNLQRLNSVDAKEFHLLVSEYYKLDYACMTYNIDIKIIPESVEKPVPSKNSEDFYTDLYLKYPTYCEFLNFDDYYYYNNYYNYVDNESLVEIKAKLKKLFF